MRLPGPGVWGPPTDRDEAIRTVRRAVELGVRVIDSAWYYGLDVANEVIAAAIRPYPDDLVLITKLGGARADDGTWVSGLTPDALRAGCERDLRVLGIDAVPVVHLRWMDRSAEISFNEALDVMLDLQAQGKIQRIGLSNVTAEQLSAALAKTPIASVSNHFGPAEQSDAATLEMCAAQQIAYLPFFPLGAGRAVTATGNSLGAVAARHNATPAQVAIAWLLGAIAGDAADSGYEQGSRIWKTTWPRPRCGSTRRISRSSRRHDRLRAGDGPGVSGRPGRSVGGDRRGFALHRARCDAVLDRGRVPRRRSVQLRASRRWPGVRRVHPGRAGRARRNPVGRHDRDDALRADRDRWSARRTPRRHSDRGVAGTRTRTDGATACATWCFRRCSRRSGRRPATSGRC